MGATGECGGLSGGGGRGGMRKEGCRGEGQKGGAEGKGRRQGQGAGRLKGLGHCLVQRFHWQRCTWWGLGMVTPVLRALHEGWKWELLVSVGA